MLAYKEHFILLEHYDYFKYFDFQYCSQAMLVHPAVKWEGDKTRPAFVE